MQHLAYFLGESVASCLLWWPIGFLAVKGSLKLGYKWTWFLAGYAGAVLVNTVALAFLGVPQHAAGGAGVGYWDIAQSLLPLAGCVAVALAMAPRLRATG
jgi:hypothetical protein